MEITRPWSLSLSYIKDRLATYFCKPAPVAILSCAVGIGVTVLGVVWGKSITEEAVKIFATASSSASSAEHETVLKIANLLYYVRCSVASNTWNICLAATTATTIYLIRDLFRRISHSVNAIEAAKSKIYAVVADKFMECPRCAHKMSCAFHSYEQLKIAAERAQQDIGVDLFALQNEAALREKNHSIAWKSIFETFMRPRIEVADREQLRPVSAFAESIKAPSGH